MKMRFVGKVWKVLVGVKDGLVLILMLLFFGGLYMLLSADPSSRVGQGGALLLDISGTIVEQPSESSPFDMVRGGSSLTREYRLRDVVHALDTAATDDRIKAVALDLDIFAGGGQAALADVGAAMESVKRAHKPVFAYATGYSDDSYQLASHASEIWLNPLGGVLITGPGGTNLYFKALLDRIGVTANVYKAGTYKSATEPLTRTGMSPEAREAEQALYGALWESWQQEVRQARPKAQVAAYVASPIERLAASGGDMAKAALAAGLIDRIGDHTAFGRRIAAIVGARDQSVPGSYKAVDYDAWTAANPVDDGSIGVVTVAGDIVDGEAGPGTAGGDTIAAILRKAIRDEDLKALVVRVDSPGGSTMASERIRQAVLDVKSSGIPVVISMGSVAASGGYWVATAGDTIFAEPSTITGSIGVFGVLPSFEGAIKKLGIGADTVQTTPLTGEPNVFHGFSPEAGRMIQMGVDSTYHHFLTLVAGARKLPVARVDQIAQGRVWDGGTARQLGLVDRFGTLHDAIAEAARRAGIAPGDAKPLYLDEETGLWRTLLGRDRRDETVEASRDVFSQIGRRPERLLLRALADAQQVLAGPTIQARCLECPSAGVPSLKRAEPLSAAWLMSQLKP